MRTFYKLFLFLFVLAIVSSCQESKTQLSTVTPPVPPPPPYFRVIAYAKVQGSETVSVMEFILPDGTRCITSSGWKVGGGISCDWKKQDENK